MPQKIWFEITVAGLNPVGGILELVSGLGGI